MTYHLSHIDKGVYGEASKILEETEEFMDALEQNCDIMALVELSDLIGAIKGYLNNYHPSIDIRDLESMAYVTHRAFVTGHRQ